MACDVSPVAMFHTLNTFFIFGCFGTKHAFYKMNPIFLDFFCCCKFHNVYFHKNDQAHLYYKVLDVYTSPFKKIKFLLNISGEIFFKVDHFKPFFGNFPIVQCLTFLAPTVQHQTDCNTRLSAPSS